MALERSRRGLQLYNNKVRMMVYKVIAKLRFNYPLKYNLFVCHSFLIFPFDLPSFVCLILYNRNLVAGCGKNLVIGCANFLLGFGFEHINIM
jgi:hypothetical protein